MEVAIREVGNYRISLLDFGTRNIRSQNEIVQQISLTKLTDHNDTHQDVSFRY